MQVPDSMKTKEDDMTKEFSILRAPSYFQELEGVSKEEKESLINNDFDDNEDWKSRLKHWRENQQSQGAIKDFTEVRKSIFDSASMSVLATLQTPISRDRIANKVETIFLNGCRRMAGLFLFSKLLSTNLADSCIGDVSNWMVSGIRNGSNNLSHYLNNIEGCGNHIEFQIRTHFFSIMKNLIVKLKNTKDKEEAICLLDALRWKFQGRDFNALADLGIFHVLRNGNGSRNNIIKRRWGHALKQVVEAKNSAPSDLTKEVLMTFEALFLNLVSRIVENDTGDKISTKTKGTSVPQIERAKSVIDTSASEALLGSAFDVLFKELDRYIQVMGSFEGIDWATYVTVRNKEKKDGAEPEVDDNALLLDEEEAERLHKKKKEELKKKREEAKAAKEKAAEAESQPAEEKAAESTADEPVSTFDVKVEVAEETKGETTEEAPKAE